MADNTVELTLQANVADFERAIKAGIGTFTGQMREASRTATTQSQRIKAAMGRIGVRPFADIEREIRGLQRDYKTLASSGELSSRALTQAHVRMREGIRALRSEQNGWVESLGRAQGALLATGAAMAGIVLVLRNATREYLRFEQAMAAVNSIIEVSPERFGALSDQVRELSLRMGRDATKSAQALYDILSSGVTPDNSIAVLEKSIRAAVAGITDTQTAARVGLAVINAYGKSIDDLGQVYDVLFQTTKAGVTTLPELAGSLGQVLSVAAGAKIPFETLAAVIAQLTLKGLGTAQAITGLRGAIVQLTSPTPAAAAELQKLGVTTGNFMETVRQLAALHLDPSTLRNLIPDVEGRNAVIALTRDMDGLTASIEGMQHAAGATDAAYAKIADTDTQSVKEYNAALGELQKQFGELVAAATPALNLLTGFVKVLEGLPGPVKTVLVSLGAAAAGFVLYEFSFGRIIDALRLATAGAGRFGQALRALASIRFLAWAGVVLEVAHGLDVWIKGQRELAGIEQRYKDFVATQRELQAANRDAADTQRLSMAQLKALTSAELASYAARERAARDYYTSVRDLRARQNARENGPTAQVDAQALAAAHEARLYREQLAGIKTILANREQVAIEHRQRLAAVKQEELQAIQKALAGEVKAFNDANAKLKAAQQSREQTAKAFKDLQAELAAGPKTPDSELTVLDINRQFNAAQGAFNKGDLEGALQQLDRGREIIRSLAEQGAASKQYFVSQTQRLAALADQVGAAQVKSAQEQVDKARKAIQDLVAKAQFLKTIEIGFDVNGTEQSAEALRARLKAILADNPLIVPVQIAKPTTDPSAADKRAAELLGITQQKATGGLIRGPGTPTSDSVLARLSNGEYVVRAAAVSKYGTSLLDAINHLSLPGFATGGLVDNLRIPSVSAPASAGATGTPVHLHLGGQSYQVSAAPDIAAALAATVRREALKAGRQ